MTNDAHEIFLLGRDPETGRFITVKKSQDLGKTIIVNII